MGACKLGIFRDHISNYSKLLANRRRISTSSIGSRTSAGVEHRKASPTNAFNERSLPRTNAYNERGQRRFERSYDKGFFGRAYHAGLVSPIRTKKAKERIRSKASEKSARIRVKASEIQRSEKVKDEGKTKETKERRKSERRRKDEGRGKDEEA